jgi:signal transduction histidine kinase
VVRHARATTVKITLRVDSGRLVLEIEDNGRGITKNEIVAPKSLGLLGMRERALSLGGEVNITGVPGQGTKVTVRIPWSG